MSARGQPFRFLAVVALGWIGARILLLWPQTGSLPEAIKAFVPPRTTHPPAPVANPPPAARSSTPAARRIPARTAPIRARPAPAYLPALSTSAIDATQDSAAPSSPLPPGPRPLIIAAPIKPYVNRWTVSGWFVARAGSGIGAAPGTGQLGGGQAGIRIAYLLAPRQRITAFARVTTPLAGKGREAAIGVEWQPTRLPLRMLAEQRIGLDGTPGGPGLGVNAGMDKSIRGFRLEGYGQAGAIARDRVEPYADGAVRITRPIAPRLSLGAGAWGGAQRDAQRLDIGPTATLALGPVRLSLDWRQRIAGRARPGSGLALTLGGDF